MTEVIDQAVRASLDRVSAMIKDELSNLISVYPLNSAIALSRLENCVAEVRGAYQYVATSLLLPQQDSRQNSGERDPVHGHLSGEASSTASNKAGNWHNGVVDTSNSGGPGTPPARSFSPTLPNSSPTAGAAPANHDVEELLMLSMAEINLCSPPGSQQPLAQADFNAEDTLHQQSINLDPQDRLLIETDPASGSSSNSGRSASHFTDELLRGIAAQQFTLDQPRLQLSSPDIGSPNLQKPAGQGDKGSRSDSMWGNLTPLDAFLRAQNDGTSGSLKHQSSNTLSAENDAQSTGGGTTAGFGRFVSPGASASPSFLKSVHAALTVGHFAKPGDGSSERSSAPATSGRPVSGPLPPASFRTSGAQANPQSASSSGLLFVGTGDAQQDASQGWASPHGAASPGPIPAVAAQGTSITNSRNSPQLQQQLSGGTGLSASLVAQHNLLQQAVQQQQQKQQQQANQLLQQQQQQQQAQQLQLQQANQQLQQQQQQQQQAGPYQQYLFQQQQDKLQQQQQQLLLAHEQQRIAHEMQLEQQLEQLNGANLVQYGPGSNQQIQYQVDPVTGNVVAVLSQGENLTFQQLNQEQGGNYMSTTDPAFTLFDNLQPTHPNGGNYMTNSAQHTLSMFAAAAGNRSFKHTSQNGQPLELQAHPTFGANGISSLLDGNGQLNMINNGGSVSAPLFPMNNTVNSEPLPLLMAGGNYGGMMTNYGPTSGQLTNNSNPDLSYLSARLQGGGGSGNVAGLLTVGAGGMELSPGARLLAGGNLAALSLTANRSGMSMGLGNTPPSSPLTSRGVGEMPGRFKILPVAVQQRIMALCRSNPVISIRDFDEKVVSKLSLLVDSWGTDQALAMLEHLEHRMRTKQGAMKNGPGYLDVAVCSHLDMLKAQGTCPKSMKLDEYAQQVLAPPVFHELCEAVNGNRWLAWEHFDQGIIQLVKRLPTEGAVEKLQEITYHSFKNVDNIKGCIMSILNSKIREDRRRQ